jgi:hypothetical protein
MLTGNLLSGFEMTTTSKQSSRRPHATTVLPVFGAWLQELKVVATVLNCAKYHESPWKSMRVHIVTPLFANKRYMPANIGYSLGFSWVS